MNKNTLHLKDQSGIYSIRNIINNKIYIGQTKCFHKRHTQHKSDYNTKNTKHLNSYILSDMYEFGIHNFEFNVIEYCSEDVLKERELYWQLELKTTDYNFGYNLRLDTSKGMLVHTLTVQKQSDNLKEQWKSGVRNEHGRKLKENWAKTPERNAIQSQIMSKILTKYEYEVIHPSGEITICNYQDLVKLKIQGAFVNINKKQNCNFTKCKGYKVTKRLINE